MAQNFTQYEIPTPPPPELPLVISDKGMVLKDGEFSSPNFVTGQKGWMINSNGDAEFNAGVAVDSLDIPDTTTAASFHVDTSGNVWWGSTTISGSVASVSAAGVASFSNVTITGGSVGGTSTDILVEKAQALFNGMVFLGDRLDTLTADTTGATVTRRAVNTYVETVATTSSNGGLRMDAFGLGTLASGATVKWNSYDMDVSFAMQLGQLTNQDVFIGVFRTGSGASDDATSTIEHIGFYIADGTIYGSNANGTTQTRTDISSGITLTNLNAFRFVYDVGVNIKFYINDTLVATHTTNMPTNTTIGEEPEFYITLKTQENVAKKMIINNNYFIKLD